jgi:predicted Fe-Mo cluster-binding NifX family protein
MKIAVTYCDGQIFQHFGHTAQFKVYDVTDGRITATSIVDTGSSGHGALAGLLKLIQAEVLICGGIGGGAQMALAEAGIQLYGGVTGDADDAVADYLAGQLAYNPCVRCNHHDHHHGEGHTCGDHGCGSHCGGHN